MALPSGSWRKGKESLNAIEPIHIPAACQSERPVSAPKASAESLCAKFTVLVSGCDPERTIRGSSSIVDLGLDNVVLHIWIAQTRGRFHV